MAEIKLRFEIDDNGTVRVLDDVKDKTKGVGDEAEKSATRASKAFDVMRASALATVAAVGTATAGVAAAVAKQFQDIDELAKVSRATGVAVKDLSSLQFAADLAGVSLQGLGTALSRFSRNVVDAQTGGNSAKLFDAIGLDVQSGRSTMRMLEDVADRFQELGTGIAATNLSQELFGRSGTRFINLLVGGSEAIRAAAEEARILGLVIDTDVSDAVEQANDDISRLVAVGTGLARGIAADIAPNVAALTTLTVEWAKQNREVIASGLGEFVDGLPDAIDAASRSFGGLADNIGTVASGVGDLGRQFAGLPTPLQAAILGGIVGGRTGALVAGGASLGLQIRDAATGAAQRDFLEAEADFERRRQGGGTSPYSFPPVGDLADPISRRRRIAEANREVLDSEKQITGENAKQSELADKILAALNKQSTTVGAGGRGGTSGAYGPGSMPLPFVAALEEGERQMALLNTQAAEFPVAVQDWTAEIENAQKAAIDLGDLLADSLTGAVDSLLARDGGFDLGDTLEGVGRAAMSRMVGAMLREKLQFDIAFEDNFLGFLPRIASQGGDLIAQGFGRGMQSLAQQSANLGSVITGSLSANGVVSFGNGGQSVDAMNFGGMTDAATGASLLVSGGAPLAQGAAGAAGGLAGMMGGLSAVLGPIALLGGLASLATGLFGLLDSGPGAAEIGRRNVRDLFRDANLVRGFALQEPDYRLVTGERGPSGSGEYTAQLVDINRQGTPIFQPGDPRLDSVIALAALTQEDPTKLSRSQFAGFLADVPLRAGQFGLSESYFRGELGLLAGGLNPVQGLIDLNAGILQNSGGRLSQADYDSSVRGLFDLLDEGGQIQRGVDAYAIALANLEETTRGTIVNFKEFGDEFERQTQVAQGVSRGVTGAAGTLAGDLLRGDVNARAAFGNSVLDAALGGVGQNVVTRLFMDGGPLAGFEETLSAAVLGGDPDALRSVLDGTGEAFGTINEKLAGFLPIFEEFRQEIEIATGATRQNFLDQRDALRERIEERRFAGLTPAQQQAELQRRIRRGRIDALEYLTDGLDSDEIDPYNRAISSVSDSSFSLLNLAGGYAVGSPERRALEQEAYNSLGFADSALSIAAESLDAEQMNVKVMYVDQVFYKNSSAVGG